MKTTLALAVLLAMTGASAMAQGTQDYPPCSATRQDRCIQTPRHAVSRTTRHARNERSARMHRMHRQQHAMNAHHRHAMRTHHRRHEQTRRS